MRKLYYLFALLIPIIGLSQQRPLNGTVVDPRNAPMAGVTVTLRGTNKATVTDERGNFTITASPNDVVRLSYLGQQKDVTVGAATSQTFVFDPQANQMSEVVVTALGQTRSKAKVGYSTTTINTEALNRSSPISPIDALAGKVAGADISKLGGPGSSAKVVLRGYGVISGGSNQPLYVIDGIPLIDSRPGANDNGTAGTDFGNGANDINPNDIESITILKGTAASSLYGSAARNGAIMITTKRGRSGKLKVEYSGGADFSLVGKLPTFQSTFGQGWNNTFVLSENGSWGPRLDGKQRLWGPVVDNSQLIKPFSFVDNNIRDFYETGTDYTNTVSLSGGSDNSQFYFSYGNATSNGVLPGPADLYERNTFALRTNSKFNNLTINSSFNYINKTVHTPFTGQSTAQGGSTFEALLQIPVDIPISDFRDYKNKYFDINSYFSPYDENPYYPLYENSNVQKSDRFFGNLDLNYHISNSFSAQLRFGGDFSNARTFGYKAVNDPAPGSWNKGGNVEGAIRPKDVGMVYEQSDFAAIINGDFILKYNHQFSTRFNIEALAGFNYNEQDAKTFNSTITNLTVPNFYNLSNTTQPPVVFDLSTQKRFMGGYAQVVLGYADQLYLTLNGRNDWASTLPINNDNFFYPGASLSWLANNALGLNGTKVSLLKFRASYGKTGTPPLAYLTNQSLSSANLSFAANFGIPFGALNFPFNGINAFSIQQQIPNNNLAPIITSEAEIGTELRMFKNRIGLDLAVYDKRTKGQIFPVPIDPSTGYATIVKNLGTVDNKGIEVTFDARPVNMKNFTWNLTYTFSKNWNKVLDLNGGPNPFIEVTDGYNGQLEAIPGKSALGFYAPVPQFTSDGKIIVNPQTGLPLVANDKGYYGDAQYDFMMGLQNTFAFKNLQLSFTLDFRKGGVMYSGTSDLVNFTGNGYTTTYNDRRPFIIPNSVVQNGVDPNNKPVYVENTTAINESNYYGYYYSSTNPAQSYKYTVIDRSFLKLRDITLSYRLPAAWASKISASSLSVAVYGHNFLLWTPKSNIYVDPEASNLGNDLAGQIGEFRTAPLSKQFGVSLKASF